MPSTYLLQIASENASAVADIIGMPSSAPADRPWTASIEVADDEPYVPFIDKFTSLLDGKIEKLSELTGSPCNISLWVLYGYDQQCNLEFSPEDMQKLAARQITLCISCWQQS